MSRIRSLATTEFLLLGGVLAFVVVALGLESLLSLNGPIDLGPPTALLFGSLPGILWLSYFHIQDRLEHTPKHFVLPAFVAGAFVAGPTSSFLIAQTAGSLAPPLSLQVLSQGRWVYALAIVAVAQEASKYVVVRYSIYRTEHFNSPLDGMIYMSATGLGVASYLNYTGLMRGGGAIYLSAAAVQVVVVSLAHASFAGIQGFAMGHAKAARGHFGRVCKLVAGLAFAATANGAVRLAADTATTSRPGVLWPALAVGFVFAGITFAALWLLMNRFGRRNEEAGKPETSVVERFRERHALAVLMLALALLAGGALMYHHYRSPTLVFYEQQGLALKHPAGWLSAQRGANRGHSQAIIHQQFVAPEEARRRIEIRITKRPTYPNLHGVLEVHRLGQYGEYYWSAQREEVEIAKQVWARTEFRYAFKAQKTSSPQIAEAIEYAAIANENLYVVTLHGAPGEAAHLGEVVAHTLRISAPTSGKRSEELRP